MASSGAGPPFQAPTFWLQPSALPVVSIESSWESWIQPAQQAIQTTSGVCAITGLKKVLTWDEACILCDMVLKSYMSATQRNPTELHPGVDLEKGEGNSTSTLTIQTFISFRAHVDRGLFNVVLGTRSSLRALHIILNGTSHSVYDLTTGDDDTLLAIVLPGLSFQMIEPKVRSPTHWVQRFENCSRVTQVFRCRLRPEFTVGGKQIEKVLEEAQSINSLKFD